MIKVVYQDRHCAPLAQSYNDDRRTVPNTKKKSGLTPRVVALIVAALLVANMVLGFVLARQSENALAEQAQARMLDVSNSAATLLNGDELATLTAQDAGSPAYDRAMSTLRAFQDSVELSYIYCVRERPDGTFEFTVDPTVGDPADFGEDVVYTEALGRAAKGEKEVDTTPYTDRWGTFYSSYSPVFDSNGKVASIVVVDFPAAWFEDRANFFTRIAVVDCLASLVMALIAAHVAVRLARSEKRNVKNMERAHHYEGLTGLPNMGYFCEIAEPARDKLYAEGKTPTILYMDLVDMKYFNHKFGFAEGDKLLRAFAQYLAEQFGHEHCSRFGQDHFVVGTTDEGLDERLDAFFEGCKRVNGGNSLPVSVGVYRDVSGQVSIGEACDRARLACMRSGAGYESRYVYFTDDMVEETSLRQHVLENFDRALDEGWIQVYYQPIVRSSTGKVCDEEALARWNDPERGLLSPDVFIPVLEDAKLIHKLDLHVLDRVLEKMARVADAGLFVVPTSLNLSRFDFEVCDIVDEVTKRVDASRFGRDMINIEITETNLYDLSSVMREQVARFHRRGFEVWMDDFGSEYSSLDYLQRLKFDLIKFDMSFMQQFGEGDRSRIILTELVKMAFGLGVDTVVEGVETQEQVDFLREVGCSMLQGYFYTLRRRHGHRVREPRGIGLLCCGRPREPVRPVVGHSRGRRKLRALFRHAAHGRDRGDGRPIRHHALQQVVPRFRRAGQQQSVCGQECTLCSRRGAGRQRVSAGHSGMPWRCRVDEHRRGDARWLGGPRLHAPHRREPAHRCGRHRARRSGCRGKLGAGWAMGVTPFFHAHR